MKNQPVQILLVENEKAQVELVRRAFEFYPGKYSLAIVSSVKQARKYLAKSTPALIITELLLPDGKGTDLLQIKEKGSRIPVVMLTDPGKEQVAGEGIKSGALDYVVKSESTVANMPYIVEHALREWSHLIEHKRAVEELKRANEKILELQKATIEEERLRAILQIIGAITHDLNQPLMALLGIMDLMKISKERPEKLDQYMARLEEAGLRIADFVKEIQATRHYETEPCLNESSIILSDQKINILSVVNSDDDFERINVILKDEKNIHVSRARLFDEAMEISGSVQIEVILLDCSLPEENGLDFFRRLQNEGIDIPVMVMTGLGDEIVASQIIRAGAYHCLQKENLTDEALLGSIDNVRDKARLKREKKALEKMADKSFRARSKR